MIKHIFSAILFLSFCGCKTVTHVKPSSPIKEAHDPQKPFAKAALEPKSGTYSTGEASFYKKEHGLEIVIAVKNVTAGKHGIHIHEKGDCSATDASSAGDHYNPAHLAHGALDPAKHHAGDLGNIEVDEQGNGKLDIIIDNSKEHMFNWDDFIGKSIVLHEHADDLTTQPSGNSGKRIACGVITAH